MKTHAGNLRIKLPLAWRDASSYVYAANDADMEIRVSVEIATPATDPELILDQIQRRTALVAEQANLRRAVTTIEGKPAHTLSFDAKTKDEPDSTHTEFLVFKPDDTRCITISGMCPSKDAPNFAVIWRDLLANLAIVPIT